MKYLNELILIACFEKILVCFQKLLCASFSYPLPLARHAGWITRELMLKVFHSTEVLPIRIFYTAFHYRFIAEIVGEFQVIQSRHQSGRNPRPSVVFTKSYQFSLPLNTEFGVLRLNLG